MSQYHRQPNTQIQPVERVRDLLSKLFPRVFPILKPKTGIEGFEIEVVEGHRTTERRSTGQTGTDFHIYPVLRLTADINGDFTIEWKFVNRFDGEITYDSEVDKGMIVNTWSSLQGGRTYEERLLDNTPSGQERGQGIGIGDMDFVAMGLQDGNWHSFQTNISGTVTSPSGATASFSGQFGPEDFRSWSELTTEITSFDISVVQD